MCSRNHCQDAKNSGMVRTCWSKMVAAIITTTNDGEDREGWQTRCSAVSSSRQTRIFGKFSAVLAIAATADFVENKPNRSSRGTRNARGRGSGQGSDAIQTTETRQIWKQVDGWSIASLETSGRGMERIGDWSNGADDARVENTKIDMLGVETNDDIDDRKMWTSRDISDSTT